MTRIRVHNFSISIDGYGAGPDQSREHPLGRGGEALHDWLIATRSWRHMHGLDGGEIGLDDAFAARANVNASAWIMGRNMFGPVRGPWPDERWQGWWGEDPPFHAPVIVLTHNPRAPIEMKGGTRFEFVDTGIHAALEAACNAAGERDIVIGGGVATIRQFLAEGLIDELHVAIAPILLGGGEHLLTGMDLPHLGYRCIEHVPTKSATHVVLAKNR